MRAVLAIENVNGMSDEHFCATFADVAEATPWVAAAATARRPFASRNDMIAAFQRAVETADRRRQRDLLVAHPDLAGKAAVAGELTEASGREQAGAGLDRLTRAEFAEFGALNSAYRQRHGIPFIYAVRGASKNEVLAAFRDRLGNPPDIEFEIALAQVCRIIRFRIEERVSP